MNAFKRSDRQLNIKSIIFYAVTVLICVAACVLLLCFNITHSVALEQEVRCGIEEHTHEDSCYNEDFLICKKMAHTHDGNCYIVLLKENNINEILTMLSNNENHSLENVITDTMSTALNFNDDLNGAESSEEVKEPELDKDTVEELNNTISNEEDLPNLVLNENINNLQLLALGNGTEQTQPSNNASTLSIGDSPVTSSYNANFYIYLDGKWTCIGSLPFTTQRSSNRYNCVINTNDVLNLVNDSLGTDYAYNSFDISVATSLNGTYSTSNIGMESVTTTIAYRQSSNNSRTARYVRLIPNNGSASSTAFAFYTVTYMNTLTVAQRHRWFGPEPQSHFLREITSGQTATTPMLQARQLQLPKKQPLPQRISVRLPLLI